MPKHGIMTLAEYNARYGKNITPEENEAMYRQGIQLLAQMIRELAEKQNQQKEAGHG